jgi:hypothetical protein
MPILRQTPDFHSLTPDGRATERKDDASLAYQVAIEIAASPERVMQVLTNAAGFTRWNSTLLRFEGEIVLGRKVTLVSTVAPKRAFSVKVSALSADAMTWEDGMPFGLFRGVRSFRATKTPSGSTVFAMSEVFSGRLLKMIAKSLPDQRATFEAFARDLKTEAERGA